MTTKRIKTETYHLPSYWASALINADESGLTDQEQSDINKWVADTKPGYCVGCSEDSYFGQFNGLGCELLDFYFHKPAKFKK
jgi:hypothetical protein